MTRQEKIEAFRALTNYVLRLIKTSDHTSSGHIFARMQGEFGVKYSLDTHHGVIAWLERCGKITNKNYWLEAVENTLS